MKTLSIDIYPDSGLTPILHLVVIVAISLGCHAQTRSFDGEAKPNGAAYGSVAVAVVRKDTIVVAAESRTITDGRINPDTTCKITVVNNVVFATTGLLKGNQTALLILDYARSVLRGPEQTRYKLQTFQSGASSLLTSWLNIPEDYDSLVLSAVYRNGHSVHSMFCFFSNGKPVVVKYSFMPSIVGKRFKIGGAYDAGVRKPDEILWIGEYEEADTLLKNDRGFAKKIDEENAVLAAEALIQKQMEFTPWIVGGDIDIILVTPNGARWIQKKQNCY